MMEEALRLLREGHSQTEVQNISGILRRNLRSYLKIGCIEQKLGRNTILTKQQEEDLENGFIRLRRQVYS